MKLLVFASKLVVSGTTVNSVELAAALRDLHGFDVVFFATPGPLLDLVQQRRLRHIPAPEARFHPSPSRIQALREAVRQEQPDLVYAWDWQQAIDAFYGVYLPMQVPTVVTDMSMSLTRMLPKSLPTTFGTPELRDHAAAAGRRQVAVMLPAVDTDLNAPGAVDAEAFRMRCGIQPGDITLVTVSRLDDHMKAESITRTMESMRILGRELPVRCVIVGDGSARQRLSKLAEEINSEAGRQVIVLPGAMVDPRPAYASADIVVGMGGSALRGMAFGKPVLITGERGFVLPFGSETADHFLYRGIYGLGDGDPANAAFAARIRQMVEHPERFEALGQFSRQFVLRHFSLPSISGGLAEFCHSGLAAMPTPGAAIFDGLRTATVYLRERRFIPPSASPVIEFMREAKPAS